MEPNNMQPGTEPVQTPNPGQDDVRIIGEMPRRPAKRGLYTLIAVLVMLTVAAIFVRDQVFKIRDVEIRSVLRRRLCGCRASRPIPAILA